MLTVSGHSDVKLASVFLTSDRPAIFSNGFRRFAVLEAMHRATLWLPWFFQKMSSSGSLLKRTIFSLTAVSSYRSRTITSMERKKEKEKKKKKERKRKRKGKRKKEKKKREKESVVCLSSGFKYYMLYLWNCSVQWCRNTLGDWLDCISAMTKLSTVFFFVPTLIHL